ncbi:MAG: hypothetical protein UHC59_05485 [Fibrobacteraceae bacterium]|jgi:hypothetical protein|nr:hypothetical protein [Fibrobacteraceae bacterium]MEE1276429.1 hypothetical protein [Fibrobacteraceae bacterium]
MPINKVDRKELKEMLIGILSQSATFKMLSKDNEVNPCRITFDGMEFYIYIKNLSPAYFKNPDVWRIQLPIRADFNQLKETDIPFIVLGYDDKNKVFTTWNPYWVKQRLNAAESVSLYSRLSLQQITQETQQLQKLNLSNDGEVVAFPITKLGYYLVNIKQFFPEMTDYVAMGSKKRTEANAAYRCLCNSKNIADFAHYLSLRGFKDITINGYCRVIKKLILDGYFSRNRKIFLACDSLSEYPNVLKTFFSVPEVSELNVNWHYAFSASLKIYIQYLLELNNLNDDVEEIPVDEPQVDDTPTSEVSTAPTTPTDKNIDWEAIFTDSNGKLTRIANPQLIKLLSPVLNTEYRKLPAAYNIINDFYGNRYNTTMQLKDWNKLLNQIDWTNPYYTFPTDSPKEISKGLLKVITSDGKVFKEKNSADTLVNIIRYIGAEKIRELNINVCSANMIISEDNINPKYSAATKHVEKNFYVNTNINTSRKVQILKEISKKLHLNLTITKE